MAKQYTRPGDMHLDPTQKYYAVLATSMGRVVIELFVDKAPQTVNSFVFLASDGFYDRKIFHAQPADYLIQGGGKDGAGYTIRGENQIDTRHMPQGTVAMLRGKGLFASYCSRFLITCTTIPWCRHRKDSVFGQVIEGQYVIDKLLFDINGTLNSITIVTAPLTNYATPTVVRSQPGISQNPTPSKTQATQTAVPPSPSMTQQHVPPITSGKVQPVPLEQPSEIFSSENPVPIPDTNPPFQISAHNSWSTAGQNIAYIPIKLADLLSALMRLDSTLQHDPKRLYAFLSDLAPDQPRLFRKAITDACILEIPRQLENKEFAAAAFTHHSMMRQLCALSGISKDLAESAIEAWSDALAFRRRKLETEPDYPWAAHVRSIPKTNFASSNTCHSTLSPADSPNDSARCTKNTLLPSSKYTSTHTVHTSIPAYSMLIDWDDESDEDANEFEDLYGDDHDDEAEVADTNDDDDLTKDEYGDSFHRPKYRQLTIILHSRGNVCIDINLLEATICTLRSYRGSQPFCLRIRNSAKPDRIVDFPNDRTRDCIQLRAKLLKLLGPGCMTYKSK